MGPKAMGFAAIEQAGAEITRKRVAAASAPASRDHEENAPRVASRGWFMLGSLPRETGGQQVRFRHARRLPSGGYRRYITRTWQNRYPRLRKGKWA
jgi:hypothetical protein